jgi:methionine-gamma-lyase
MTKKIKLEWKDSTLALHGGEDKNYNDSHATPIFATSTFSFPNADVGHNRFMGKESGYIYTRLGNPTVEATEKKIAILEGASLIKQGIEIEGHAFSTGMSCIGSTLISLTKPDDVIVATNPVYGGTNYLMNGILARFNVKNALSPNVRVIFLESSANPNLCVSNISEITKLAKEEDKLTVVDNTFATPIIPKPLTLGADIVVHSTTKYLNGHGTTCSGILASKLEGKDRENLKFVKKNFGATQSPFDAFLVLNGMKTLPLRMKHHCSNALKLAEFLSEHPKVENVYYPGLPSHPDHHIAKEQMNGLYGGMISFEIKGGFAAGKSLMNSVQVFTLAVSLGTVDSLIQHPRSMTHASVPQETCLEGGITDSLVRISVGLEDIEDLKEDISNALSKT